ncbi:hypothetical protein H105_01728, partial [Trichophyton soudanense CBS 452.61]
KPAKFLFLRFSSSSTSTSAQQLQLLIISFHFSYKADWLVSRLMMGKPFYAPLHALFSRAGFTLMNKNFLLNNPNPTIHDGYTWCPSSDTSCHGRCACTLSYCN